MSGDPRKLKGAAAIAEIVERLTGLGEQVREALEKGQSHEDGFDIDTPAGKMSGRFGVRVGPAARPAAAKPRAARTAPKTPEPLVDVHFDGARVVVTTECDDPSPALAVEGQSLKIRAERAAERSVALPCKVRPETLRHSVVNGVLEAKMEAAK